MLDGSDISTIVRSGRSTGQQRDKLNRNRVKKPLNAFLKGEKTLDGSSVRAHWFPQVEADVFISHSHLDEPVVTDLAGWLSDTFGLRPFVDSCIWGCAYDLLKDIDNEYCLKDNGNYDYEGRNGSTSHVHMMLSVALQKMIDSIECLIFVNTPNSISPSHSVKKTLSPWLFMELATTKIIKPRPPARKRLRKEAKEARLEM